MASGKRIAATLAVAAGMLCAAQHAVAGESGSFTAITVLTSSYATLQQSGETVFAGPSEGASVITESSGDPFAVGSHIEKSCLTYGRISASAASLEAPCTARASTNDELYLISKRTGTTGRSALLGGTGQYEGIAGSCEYEVARVSPKVNVTTARCTWNR